jgi:hypothetical protein
MGTTTAHIVPEFRAGVFFLPEMEVQLRGKTTKVLLSTARNTRIHKSWQEYIPSSANGEVQRACVQISAYLMP